MGDHRLAAVALGLVYGAMYDICSLLGMEDELNGLAGCWRERELHCPQEWWGREWQQEVQWE